MTHLGMPPPPSGLHAAPAPPAPVVYAPPLLLLLRLTSFNDFYSMCCTTRDPFSSSHVASSPTAMAAAMNAGVGFMASTAVGCKCEDGDDVKNMVEELKTWLNMLCIITEMTMAVGGGLVAAAGVCGERPTVLVMKMVGGGWAAVAWSAGAVSGGRPCLERCSNSIKTDFGG
jgi:hypothetical protein